MIVKGCLHATSAKEMLLLFTAKLAWKPAIHFRDHARSYSTLNTNWSVLLKQDLTHVTTYTEITAHKMISKPFESAFTMN